ncbi:TlpA family protein disulfide reductase [Modestobacter altitudinis]|uniref:TlpA family protein disulfide reductase n=1 Tax=Modestobacter altitudinis TaxID=2213158 RepID=UPI001FE62F09|nr:TlpA disulfide reductase family protein [Modestobacter altitudinis]
MRLPASSHPSPRPSAHRRHSALALVAAVALASCSSNGQPADSNEFQFTGTTATGKVLPSEQRAEAPAFRGELLDGSAFNSAGLAGDIVVINFWGSWCAPCRLETPELQAVYADVRDRGVQFVGIDVKDQRQLASAFVSEVGAEYPSLFDPRGEIALTFNGFPANVVPSTILLDASGDVAAVYTGAVQEDDLRKALDSLLQENGS